ncbi:MAG: HAD family phosphatase [Anaerolineae bacterium]|nr:HAD family phosphatase [Anaerolineae bacterium]
MPNKTHDLPIRLIVADLDGTLLDSEHKLTPLTEQAVHAALARGVRFTVATGKTFPSTREHIRQFNITIPVICANGTLVHAADGTILHEEPIPREYAIEAVRMAQAAGLKPVVYAGHDLLATEMDANVAEIVAHHEPVPEIVPDIEAALRDHYKPHKLILMSQDLDAVTAFQVRLANVFEGRAQVLRSGLASVVELLPCGVTKGTALAFILEYLDIPAQQTMCLGDNFNDLDMIQRAGIGVAMSHAPEAVRAGANFVTTTNDEDGVGRAIQRFILAGNNVETRP